MKVNRIVWGSILVIITSTLVRAQFLELGASVGATTYRGDLSPWFRLEHTGGGGSLYIKNILTKAIQLKHQAGFWVISGADHSYSNPFQQRRDQSFSRSILEVTSRVEYHFLDYRSDKNRPKLTPYITAGIGFFYMLGDLPETEKVYRMQPVIPIGIGMKYPLGRQWNIGFDVISHKTFTDYLDNRGYVSTDPKFSNGNLTGSDWYFVASFHMGYTLYWVRCPKMIPRVDDQQ